MQIYFSYIQTLKIYVFMQDKVPAFSPEKAKAFIKSELGCPIEVLFKEFEDRPIAAASLGQVFALISINYSFCM